MKKVVSSVLVCVLLLSTVFVLASCGKMLNGEYENALGVTLEFSGNKVTRKWDIPLVGTTTREGTYSIEDSKITITYGDDEENSGTYEFAHGQENGVDFIKIAGIKYEKKK